MRGKLVESQAIFATIFTPQGDGNLISTISCVKVIPIRHDIYPARGRKLWCSNLKNGLNRSTIIRHDIYPARGRKLPSISSSDLKVLLTKFATIFTPQGDGNSDRAISKITNKLFLFATIFTPQGDGNLAMDEYIQSLENHRHSPRYLPRKGTETEKTSDRRKCF